MKSRKKLLIILSLCMVAFMFTACGSTEDTNTTSDADTSSILDSSSPTSFIDPTQNYNFPEGKLNSFTFSDDQYIYTCASWGIYRVERNGNNIQSLITFTDGWISNFNQYEDSIYFFYHEGNQIDYKGSNQITNICRIDLNGNNYIKFDNPNQYSFNSMWIHDNILVTYYFQDTNALNINYNIQNHPETLEQIEYQPTIENKEGFRTNYTEPNGEMGIIKQLIYQDKNGESHVIISPCNSKWIILNNRIYQADGDLSSMNLEGNDRLNMPIEQESTTYILKSISNYKDDWIYCSASKYIDGQVGGSMVILAIKTDFSEWKEMPEQFTATDGSYGTTIDIIDDWMYVINKYNNTIFRIKTDGTDYQVIGTNN